MGAGANLKGSGGQNKDFGYYPQGNKKSLKDLYYGKLGEGCTGPAYTFFAFCGQSIIEKKRVGSEAI